METYACLKRLMTSDEGFAFDPLTGYSYTINETAQRIIAGLKSGADYDAILSGLTEEYDVAQQRADRDLETFLEQLKRFRFQDTTEAASI